MTLSMKETLEVARCNRGQFQQWLARNVLGTAYDDPGQGRPRSFTLENVVELAFVTAFTKAGMPLELAVEKAPHMLHHYKSGQSANWMVFPAGGVDDGEPTNHLPQKVNMMADDVVVVVKWRQIFERIDAAFKAAAEEERS